MSGWRTPRRPSTRVIAPDLSERAAACSASTRTASSSTSRSDLAITEAYATLGQRHASPYRSGLAVSYDRLNVNVHSV